MKIYRKAQYTSDTYSWWLLPNGQLQKVNPKEGGHELYVVDHYDQFGLAKNEVKNSGSNNIYNMAFDHNAVRISKNAISLVVEGHLAAIKNFALKIYDLAKSFSLREIIYQTPEGEFETISPEGILKV